MKIALLFLLISIALLGIATQIQSPFLLRIRPWDIWGMRLGTLLAIGVWIHSFLNWKRTAKQTANGSKPRLILWSVSLLPLLAALLLSIGKPLRFHATRARVLAESPSTLKKYGQHFIVGYTDRKEIELLAQKGAIAGIFITQRNVAGKTKAQVKQEIETFQTLRKENGLPPLIIATDQEGGGVSRLSPPLDWQPTLAEWIENEKEGENLKKRVTDYAEKQAHALKEIGVTLNLSPVVDLRKKGEGHLLDLRTRIWERSIAQDPNQVIEIASIYLKTFEKIGVKTTLKHFPGLGRVSEDTHVSNAHLQESLETLEESDWKPFRTLLGTSSSFLMLGHVHVDALDSKNPTSVSKKVVQEIIRKKWKHSGPLITDDFTMRPIYWRKGGIGQAAIDALDAGVDFILISYDPNLYYEAMEGLLSKNP